MAISPVSDSYGIKFKSNATTGVPEIDGTPEKGFVPGLMNEVTGLINGGATTSVGASHTVAEGAKMILGARLKDQIAGMPGGRFLVGE